MTTTLSGSNSFLLQRELQTMVTNFVNAHGELALERLDGESASLARIREALTGLPFLSSKKLVVLRSPSSNKEFIDEAATLLANISETIDVIIVEPKLDKRLAYYKLLKKETQFTDYNEPDSNGLAAWIVRSAKEQGGSISSNDARYLIERVGINQQLVAHELDKLILHTPSINRQTIELMTEQTPQSTIFQLLEAAFAGNGKRAIGLYQEQRALKVETPQIIAMLAWQLHILAVIKTAGNRAPTTIAAEAKLSPFVVQKSATIARSLSHAKLKELVANLLDIDASSKRRNLDVDDALQLYLLQVASL